MTNISAFSKSKSIIYAWRLLVWGMLLLAQSNSLFAQCSPDSTPPSAACDLFGFVYVNSFGPNTGRISAATLNNTSTDNCTPTNQLLLRITTDPGLTTPPATTIVDLVGAPNDEIEVFLWVGDAAGNWSTCSAPVILLAPNCSPDTEAPYVVIPPDLTFSRAEYDLFDIDYFNMPDDQPKVRAAFGEAYHWDNCDNGNSNLQESYYLTGPLDSLTRVERRFFVTDAANNQATVVAQYITILDGFTVNLPAWQYPGETVIDTVTISSNNPMEVATSDLYYLAPCFETPAEGYLRLVRTWDIIDWTYTPFGGDPVVLPALDLDNDGRVGDPYEIIAIGDSIWLYQNNIPTQNLGKRATLYEYNQEFLNEQLLVTGTVFLDTTGNCTQDPGERILAGWKVKGVGHPSNVVYTAITDGDGVYELTVCPQDTLVEVSLNVPGNIAGGCPATFDVVVVSGVPGVQDIPAILNNECDLLSVDIATGNMRPCFSGSYSVSYCNLSGAAVADTYIDVALDTFVQYTSSSLPGTLQSGNTYRFETGDLDAGACSQFTITFLLDCDAPNGLTHCSEAAIFPTADCPPAGAWQGAELLVQGSCEGDSVLLEIRNIGSGDMDGALNFVVTEDLIMARDEPYQLDAGAMHTLRVPANGATWRIETPQEPGHPWGGIVAKAVEGCGGLNQPGLVNMFPNNNPNPFVSTFCRENTSSYDPNDKQAYPRGYGNEHFIKRNTDIEYMLRFQNTGTDTAFTVVLLDTLSVFLNASSVRPGASSHTYDFDLLENNVLRFRFDNILLPDSNMNEAASHGFVKFRIQQQPDNPIGTVIENSAAIFFDFNAPVITNTTLHTIGEKFVLSVSTDNPSPPLAGRLLVYPNPATESATFELPDADPSRRFVLVDGLGKIVVASPFAENTYRFERGSLPEGIYFFQVLTEGGPLFSGKIVLR
jgi:hypothetical protein